MLFRFLHTRGGGCARARGKDQASAPAHGAYARGPTLDEAKARDESGDFGLPIPLPGEDAGGDAPAPAAPAPEPEEKNPAADAGEDE